MLQLGNKSTLASRATVAASDSLANFYSKQRMLAIYTEDLHHELLELAFKLAFVAAFEWALLAMMSESFLALSDYFMVVTARIW